MNKMKNKTKIAKSSEILDRMNEISNEIIKSNPRAERMAILKAAAMPLIKLLSEEYHPHHTAIVTSTSVELLEGACSINKIYDFIVD